MRNHTISVDYDSSRDVLYIKLQNREAVTDKEDPADTKLTHSLDADGNIIGVTYCGAGKVKSSRWAKHPSRKLFPDSILEVLDDFVINGIIM